MSNRDKRDTTLWINRINLTGEASVGSFGPCQINITRLCRHIRSVVRLWGFFGKGCFKQWLQMKGLKSNMGFETSYFLYRVLLCRSTGSMDVAKLQCLSWTCWHFPLYHKLWGTIGMFPPGIWKFIPTGGYADMQTTHKMVVVWQLKEKLQVQHSLHPWKLLLKPLKHPNLYIFFFLWQNSIYIHI